MSARAPGSWLSSVRAQPTALAILRRGIASGRLHHALLFEGPDGVGKERTAFGLAQALVCERRAPGADEACGSCGACARAVPRGDERTPVHPDVVVVERGLYDPAAIGRRTPETQEISIDQVRTLVLARSAYPPHEGRAKVFVIRRAEELSTSAANALLKTLEEPGARTHFVLLTSAPDSLLPTILSRTLRVRFGALPEALVREILVERGVDGAQATRIAPMADGSMVRALGLADPDESSRRDQFVARVLAAVDARDGSGVFDVSEEAKKTSKELLVADLHAVAAALADRARASAAAADTAADVAAARHALAIEGIRQLDANASVQLAVESMLIRMRGA